MKKKFILSIFLFLASVANASNSKVPDSDDTGFCLIKQKTFKLSAANLMLNDDEKFIPKVIVNFISATTENLAYQIIYEGSITLIDSLVPSSHKTDKSNIYASVRYKF